MTEQAPAAPSRERSVYECVRADECAALSCYYEGSLNALFCAISYEQPRSAERAAIQASAQRGGFAADDLVWITIMSADTLSADEENLDIASSLLDGAGLLQLVEAIDPLGVVMLDQKAAEVASRAYNQPVKLEACDSLLCRPYCAFADFARMLETDERKQRAWSLLKELLARIDLF